MSGLRHKSRKWKSNKLLIDIRRKPIHIKYCPNCGKEYEKGEGHLVPACLGDPNIWICEKKKDEGNI